MLIPLRADIPVKPCPEIVRLGSEDIFVDSFCSISNFAPIVHSSDALVRLLRIMLTSRNNADSF